MKWSLLGGMLVGVVLSMVFGMGFARKFPSVLSATTDKTVEQRLASLENRVYVLEKNAGLIKTSSLGKTKEYFVSLTGGSVESYDWVALSGSEFVLDTGLYGANVEVSWQGWMDGGSGMARVYDLTNKRVVDFSEVTLKNPSKSSFYSKPMMIWRGQNQYRIEVKSLSGPVTISSARLKILVK